MTCKLNIGLKIRRFKDKHNLAAVPYEVECNSENLFSCSPHSLALVCSLESLSDKRQKGLKFVSAKKMVG